MIRELTIAAAIAGAAVALAPSAAADPGPMFPDDPGHYDIATDVPGMNYDALARRAVRQLSAVHLRSRPRRRAVVCHYIPNQWPPVYTGFWVSSYPLEGRAGHRRAVRRPEVGGAGAGRPPDGVPRRAGLAAGHVDRRRLLPRLIGQPQTIRS